MAFKARTGIILAACLWAEGCAETLPHEHPVDSRPCATGACHRISNLGTAESSFIDDELSLLQVVTHNHNSRTSARGEALSQAAASSEDAPTDEEEEDEKEPVVHSRRGVSEAAKEGDSSEQKDWVPLEPEDTSFAEDSTDDSHQSEDGSPSSNDTEPSKPSSLDRYPAIFHDLNRLLGAVNLQQPGPKRSNQSNGSNQSNSSSQRRLKLLSFGCGDDSECKTLRSYFPDALIDGVDADARLIAKNAESAAKRKDPRTRYLYNATQLAAESYDAVLALSVLCSDCSTKSAGDWPADHLPYRTFIDTMHLLDRLVRPGGYLVIYNAEYPFSEFPDANRYKNMATGCGIGRSFNVLTVDQKGENLKHPNAKRGECTSWGKYCMESGWRKKFDHLGEKVQPAGAGWMSFGCMYPGSFFKKVKSML